MSVAALLWIGWLASTLQGDAWAQVWAELDRLRSGESPAEEADLRSRLAEIADAHASEARGELLRAALESRAGRDARAAALRLANQAEQFQPIELWFLADLLPAGHARVAVVTRALEAPPAPTRWQFLVAWNTAAEEVRALRLSEALPIQELLERRYQAAWSASDLAATQRLLGDRAAVDELLGRAIERETAAGRPTGELWCQLGIADQAFGDPTRARDHLGRALALGSDDAGLALARMDLVSGRTGAARVGFRALILNQPPLDWAWRGWGTTLLPAATAEPVLLPHSDSHPPANP